MGTRRIWPFQLRGEGRRGGGGGQRNGFADEAEVAIADERAGEQVGFDEDLEAVADAEDEATLGGVFFERGHDGRVAGDGAAAEVVAIGEAAGEDDEVEAVEAGGIVPDEFGGHVEIGGEGVPGVVVAIAAWKNDDSCFHVGDDFRVAVGDGGENEAKTNPIVSG